MGFVVEAVNVIYSESCQSYAAADLNKAPKHPVELDKVFPVTILQSKGSYCFEDRTNDAEDSTDRSNSDSSFLSLNQVSVLQCQVTPAPPSLHVQFC